MPKTYRENFSYSSYDEQSTKFDSYAQKLGYALVQYQRYNQCDNMKFKEEKNQNLTNCLVDRDLQALLIEVSGTDAKLI